MDHITVINEDYRFVLNGDFLRLEKRTTRLPLTGTQWVDVLGGSLEYGEVDGHYNGFTIQEMRMFIEKYDEVREGRQ